MRTLSTESSCGPSYSGTTLNLSSSWLQLHQATTADGGISDSGLCGAGGRSVNPEAHAIYDSEPTELEPVSIQFRVACEEARRPVGADSRYGVSEEYDYISTRHFHLSPNMDEDDCTYADDYNPLELCIDEGYFTCRSDLGRFEPRRINVADESPFYTITPPPTPVDVAGLLCAANTPPLQTSPLLALQEKIAAFFSHGPTFASFAFVELQQSLAENRYISREPFIKVELKRHTSKLLSTLSALDRPTLVEHIGYCDGYKGYDGLSALASLNGCSADGLKGMGGMDGIDFVDFSDSGHLKEVDALGCPVLNSVHTVDSVVDASLQEDLWQSNRVVSALVLLSAASRAEISTHSTLGKHSRLLNNAPPFRVTQETPSASLRRAMQRAKVLALRASCTTVMAVMLVDVRHAEMAALFGDCTWEDSRYLSFGHVFTLGIGPEGVIIWQAWGPRGYRLDDYIRAGHARVRSWDEADAFLTNFEELTSSSGIWDTRRNQLYRRLFHIDVDQICKSSCLSRLITPHFEPWVRIHTLQNVVYENMNKFRFV